MLNLYTHEPLTQSGWKKRYKNLEPEEALGALRMWQDRGFRVALVSIECDSEGWDFNLPVPA